MKALIILRRVKVENANSIAGLTWGFPSVSHFLGFTHALDRKLRAGNSLPPTLGGVGIICHHHQLHTDCDDYGEHRLALTRNPLTKDGKTAPFNEEGRMHVEVSLFIECNLNAVDYAEELELDDEIEDSDELLCKAIERIALSQRLAGGFISRIGAIEYLGLTDDMESLQQRTRAVMYKSLPGFALVDRSPLLDIHFAALKKQDSDITQLQAWMDFGGLRHRATNTDENEYSEWTRVPLPESGWFVPLMVGYQAIAELVPPGNVEGSRDTTIPFCAVEPIHGVGQWISPHRVSNLESLLWRYPHNLNDGYRFINHFLDNPIELTGE